MPNQSHAEQFDHLYGQLWRAFFKADAGDLSQHERQLLNHIPAENGIPLGDVARHLGIPKSSASEQVKSLERRGFLTRRRDPDDERRLSIVLTPKGVADVREASVLDLVRLAAALEKVTAGDRQALFAGLKRLAAAAKNSGPVYSAVQATRHTRHSAEGSESGSPWTRKKSARPPSRI
jgi:MarR family transcriptional regulator, organic hydroperoxide resistance regulator